MNVGHPSNLARIFALYGGQMDENGRVERQPDIISMHNDLYTISITDEETRRTIKESYDRYRILLEPHGAVGWAGLMKYLDIFGDWSPCISLETADPAKFPDEIIRLTGVNPPIPEAMERLDDLEEHVIDMSANYENLKSFLEQFSMSGA
jgi:threonine synthase